VAVKNCSGLCSFETGFLTATAMVVDLVVYLVVVGLGLVGRVYPREGLTRLTCLHLASIRHYL
jgi:hypothetical protein